ncbi:MAG TPA: DUF3943 domain-containing protein [Candidatus Eisenbacteria bacterium]
MFRRRALVALLLLTLPAMARAQESAPPDTTVVEFDHPKPLRALGEVVGTNLAIWTYDRYIRENGTNPGFRIGFNSWEENMLNGFEWDDNNFKTNQFAHPYHGSMYFNAARSSGYDFWTSIPFAFTGSILWEYMFEIHHPSYNDWIATSVGGTTLGEMMHRLSSLILDDRDTGGSRRWRELGALLVDPMRGLNRIIDGDVSRVGPNPSDWRPGYLGMRFDAGLRVTGEDKLTDADTTRAFISLEGQYGDPFGRDRRKPFDTFGFGVDLNFGDASVLSGVRARGLLAAADLKRSEKTNHLLGAFLNFDYANTNAYTLGGQSIGAGVMSRFDDTFLGDIRTEIHANAVILGAVKSDYESYTGRAYDYGPGASAIIAASLVRNNRPWLSVRHSEVWIHTLNGTDGEHFVSVTRARVDVPIAPTLGVGAMYQLYLSDADYTDLEDTHHRLPELRAFLSFPLD